MYLPDRDWLLLIFQELFFCHVPDSFSGRTHHKRLRIDIFCYDRSCRHYSFFSDFYSGKDNGSQSQSRAILYRNTFIMLEPLLSPAEKVVVGSHDHRSNETVVSDSGVCRNIAAGFEFCPASDRGVVLYGNQPSNYCFIADRDSFSDRSRIGNKNVFPYLRAGIKYCVRSDRNIISN